MISRITVAGLFVILVAAVVAAQSNPVPLINSFDPPSANPGADAFTLLVQGAGFTDGSVLNWNGSPRLTIVNSPNTLQAQIYADDVAQIGTVLITVVTPEPGGGISNALSFPVRTPNKTVAFGIDRQFVAPEGAVTIGDFNNDGKLDIVILSASTQKIQTYFGNGDGTFQAPVFTDNPIETPAPLVAADFNGDGNLDLAITNLDVSSGYHDTETWVVLGNGDGTFRPAGTKNASFKIPSLFEPSQYDMISHAGASDFNNDGLMDLTDVQTSREGAVLNVELGKGDGTFTRSQVIEVGQSTAFADFNGDGKIDFAVTFGSTVGVYLGNGDGTFSDNGLRYDISDGGTYSIAAADVNNDGIVDLVTDGVSVLLGNGDGTFRDGGGVQLSAGFSPWVRIADLNGDGKVDIVVNHVVAGNYNGADGQTIEVLLGNGNGTFQSPIAVPAGSLTYGPGIEVADFNSDGKLDIVVSGQTTTHVSFQTIIQLSPPTLDFGSVHVGKVSPPQVVKVTNIGPDLLTLGKINISGTNRVDFGQKNNCKTTLASGASCSIGIIYKPTQIYGEAAILNVNDSAYGSPHQVPLSGTGTQSSVTLSPRKLNFPTLLVGTSSQPQTVTVQAGGNLNVNISNISTSGPFSQTNNCPSSLSPGSTCKIQVTFTPNQKGVATGTLYVYDDAPGSPQTASLTGTGTIVKLSASSVNFGNQQVGTTSPGAPVKLTNVGTVTLNISGINFTGNNPGDFAQTNNCGGSVPGGGSCTITVTFTPQAKGTRSATMNINDDGGGSPQTVALSGTGT